MASAIGFKTFETLLPERYDCELPECPRWIVLTAALWTQAHANLALSFALKAWSA
jgi:hypothetical protein